jgi:hypothetical protein
MLCKRLARDKSPITAWRYDFTLSSPRGEMGSPRLKFIAGLWGGRGICDSICLATRLNFFGTNGPLVAMVSSVGER